MTEREVKVRIDSHACISQAVQGLRAALNSGCLTRLERWYAERMMQRLYTRLYYGKPVKPPTEIF